MYSLIGYRYNRNENKLSLSNTEVFNFFYGGFNNGELYSLSKIIEALVSEGKDLECSFLSSCLSEFFSRIRRKKDNRYKPCLDWLVFILFMFYQKHGYPMSKIAIACGCSSAFISGHFSRRGLNARDCRVRTLYARPPHRKYTVHHEAFSDLYNPDVAYWIGYLWSDGYVLQRRSDGTPEGLRVTVAPQDKHHLYLLRYFLGSDAPISDVKSTHHNDKIYFGKSLSVYSKSIASRLAELGFLERDGGNGAVTPPEIPSCTEVHYWRGVVDGDGSILRDKRVSFPLSGWEINVCGTKSVAKAFHDFVFRNISANGSIINNGKSEVNFRVYYVGVYAVRVISHLYGHRGPTLLRKGRKGRMLHKARCAALRHGVVEKYQGKGRRLIYSNISEKARIVVKDYLAGCVPLGRRV